MEPRNLVPRFTIPIDHTRPKGTARFESWAPKLNRRISLFDPFHVWLWTLLESSPYVSAYCERPAFLSNGERRQLIDFWIRAGRHEVCWITNSNPASVQDAVMHLDDKIEVRHVHAKNLVSRNVWVENWMRILPYLASNARFVGTQLLTDVEQAASKAPTLGEIERNFQPHDIVLVRTAAFMLLHEGRLKAKELRAKPLGSEIRLCRARQ